ncbi:PEP-CTERM sorting domain-containing protein [Massilia sp. H-1]|nr:PEP-CTERM sorting domain-containing protein [Massilia sp. H-1]
MVDPAYSPGLYQWNTGAVLLIDSPATLTFAPVTAFGADFGTILAQARSITVTINGVSNVITTSARPELSFYGWTSSAAITSVQISTSADYLILDNVTRAARAPAQVPEPASLALLGLGMLGLALARRLPRLSRHRSLPGPPLRGLFSSKGQVCHFLKNIRHYRYCSKSINRRRR